MQVAVNIFNEKTVAALKDNSLDETVLFVQIITRMLNILNVRKVITGCRLNGDELMPFRSIDDKRFGFLRHLVKSFSKCPQWFRVSNPTITSDTGIALKTTIDGLVNLIKLLLERVLEYVLPGDFQSGRIEGEFGVFCQGAKGNYLVAVDEIITSVKLQRLKLFHSLEMNSSNDVHKDPCCFKALSDEEMDVLDMSVDGSYDLNEIEKASLFYLSGYIAKKEDITLENEKQSEIKESEFLQLLSRGKQKLPCEK